MSKTTLIGMLVLIAMLPMLYIGMYEIWPDEPIYTFRGQSIRQIHEANGKLTIPTVEEDEKGATMHATLKPAFIEKMSGVKSPNPSGLDMIIDGVADYVRTCTPQGKIPDKASFDFAKNCAAADFAAWKAEKKTAVFIDPQQQMIVLGASGNNLARVYYKNMIATYTSPDMTQSDRKREACIVRSMLDHLLGIDPPDALNCAPAP
jgi:hypothetical protein